MYKSKWFFRVILAVGIGLWSSLLYYSNSAYANDDTTISSSNSNQAAISNQSYPPVNQAEYNGISHWIISNKDRIQKILEDTAKKSKTKWVVDVAEGQEETTHTIKIENNTNKSFLYHKVVKGDTLYRLSRKYSIGVDKIIELNKLNNNKLLVGDNLIVGIKESSNTDKDTSVSKPFDNKLIYPKYIYYKVIKGDTLSSISKAINVPVDELIKDNNIDKNQELYPGMLLKHHSSYYNNSQVSEKIFAWPLIGRLEATYGPQESGRVNEGINIGGKIDSSIKSAANGVVIYVGNAIKNFGNLILIQHKNGWISVYGYVKNMKVTNGTVVKKGEIIAELAGEPRFKVPQLHFELRKGVKPQDPLLYLNSYS